MTEEQKAILKLAENLNTLAKQVAALAKAVEIISKGQKNSPITTRRSSL